MSPEKQTNKGKNKRITRLRLFNYLRKKDIYVNIHYIPVHYHPYYKKIGFRKNDYPKMKSYYDSVLSLPVYPGLKENKISKIINYIKKILNEKQPSIKSS